MALVCLLFKMLVLSSLAGHGSGSYWGETTREPWPNPNTDGVISHKIVAQGDADDVFKIHSQKRSSGSRLVLCGRRSAVARHFQDRDVDDGLDKLIGGRPTNHGEYPWTVKIFAKTKENGVWKRRVVCGGAIINNYWVLTAAGCFLDRNKSSLFVAAGDFQRRVKDEGEQKFFVDKLISHEQFTELLNGDYNIALIKVANKKNVRGIRFNDYVQPICLPNPGQTCSYKTRVIATGWGVTSPTIFILVGIMIHGTKCHDSNNPVIFSSVCEYLNWIEVTINANSDSFESIIPTRH